MCGKQRTCRRGFLEVWQAKDLQVVSSDLWQIKDLSRGGRRWQVRRFAGWKVTTKAEPEPNEPGRVDKRKIVGTLKREILRLAQDDYPCRIVDLASHGAATL